MAASKIVLTGDPVLRRAAEPVPVEDIGTPEIQGLIDEMIATMRAAPGVGLAAPQIGVPLRILVLEDREDLMARLSPADRKTRGRVPYPLSVLVNPVLSRLGDETATFFEGCLSVPGYMALVDRALEVEVRGHDREGAPIVRRVRGWPARIFQHEVDHLDGTLYVDRMRSRSLSANAEVQARWLSAPVDVVRKALGA